MSTSTRFVPIYTSRGDLEAYMVYPYLYSRQGDWIGVVTAERLVYSIHGQYVGWLAEGPRILRKLADDYTRPTIAVKRPPKIKVVLPAQVPLAPLMSELSFGTADVLMDHPEMLPPVGFGDMLKDMD